MQNAVKKRVFRFAAPQRVFVCWEKTGMLQKNMAPEQCGWACDKVTTGLPVTAVGIAGYPKWGPGLWLGWTEVVPQVFCSSSMRRWQGGNHSADGAWGRGCRVYQPGGHCNESDSCESCGFFCQLRYASGVVFAVIMGIACIFTLPFLKPISSLSPTAVRNHPAIYVPVCAGDICTARPKNMAATKSRWGIILMTWSKQRLWECFWLSAAGYAAEAAQHKELIRPLYCVHEEDIIAWKRYNQLEFIQWMCLPHYGKLYHLWQWWRRLQASESKDAASPPETDNPNTEKSIFNSIHAVSLDTFPGYKQNGNEHSFLERYDM